MEPVLRTVRPAILVSAALLLAAAGCVPKARRAYERAVAENTEMLVISKDFGTGLRLRGTLLDAGFRRALADERRRLLGVTDDDHAAFVDRQARDAAAYHEVVFTAETAIIDTVLRFGEGDDAFRLRLEADGVVEPLITVYKVRRPTPLHEALYPHKHLWNQLWIARFERTVAAPREVVLHVGSGFGHDRLRWSNADDATR